MEKKIIIVGGGFGGVLCALDLAKNKPPNSKIILVSAKQNFEYSAALYRVVTGGSPLEACIPLRDIFFARDRDVEIIKNTITRVDFLNRELASKEGFRYGYDVLVLAVGCETSYFEIPGLEKLSFGCKSVDDALRLNSHLREVFSSCADKTKTEKVCAAHIVVVGGGATGVELSAELVEYAHALADEYALDPSLVTIELIEAESRLMPSLPPDISQKAHDRLHSLGVNIFLNRTLVKEEVDEIYLKDMEMKTKTVIWTAGVRPHTLIGEIYGLARNEKGYAVVDQFLRATGHTDVFVIGDSTATLHAGMAQTAIHQARIAAQNIRRGFVGAPLRRYKPKKPSYAIPIGKRYCAVLTGNIRIYGRLGWFIRRFADVRFFLSIFPVRKALALFREGKL